MEAMFKKLYRLLSENNGMPSISVTPPTTKVVLSDVKAE